MASIVFGVSEHIAIVIFRDIGFNDLVRLASIDVFFFSMVTFSWYILFSFQEFKKVAIVMTVNALIKFSSAFFLLILGLGIEGVVIGITCGDAVTLLTFIWLLRGRGKNGSYSIRNQVHLLSTLLNYSLPICGSQVLQILTINIDYYLVLSLSGLFTAGVYSPAVLIGTLYLTIVVGAGETLLPYFSKIYGKSGIKSLNDVSIITSRYVFLIYFPLGFAILAFSPPLITLTFGEKYSQAIYPTLIIIPAATLLSLSVVSNYILMSAGRSRIFFMSTLIALIVQIIVSVAIIPSIGANGAAIARAFSIYYYVRVSGV